MKLKASSILLIFLVIFQILSPFTLIKEKGSFPVIKENSISAQTTETFTQEPRVGYIKDGYVDSENKVKDVVFVYVDTPESTGKCYDKEFTLEITDSVNSKESKTTLGNTDGNCRKSGMAFETIKTDKEEKTLRQYHVVLLDNWVFYTTAIKIDGKPIEVNKDEKHGSNKEALLINEYTASFGPDIKNKISYLSKTQSSEIKYVSADVSVVPKSLNGKIYGEYTITIINNGSIWQDNGKDSTGGVGKDDDFGMWSIIYDDDLLDGIAAKKNEDILPNDNGLFDKSILSNVDGFILDISTNNSFTGTTTTSINLNELILKSEDDQGIPLIFKAGIISLRVVAGHKDKFADIAKVDTALTIPPLEENKDYYYRIRLYESLSLTQSLGGENGYILSNQKRFNSGTLANLDLIQDAKNNAIIQSPSNQQQSINWIPKCGTDWGIISNGGSLTGCLILLFHDLVFQPSAWLLAKAGELMDFILAYAISPDAYNAEYIKDSWIFLRDVCNLFFIFLIIYLAFRLITGTGNNTKQMLVSTFIIATVINFSYPLTALVIDTSNILSRQIYYNVFSDENSDTTKPKSISVVIASGFNPQAIIIDGLNQKDRQYAENNKASIFIILLIGVIFNIFAGLVFLKVSLQFFMRIVGLVFAMILSPLAVFSFSLDKGIRDKLKFAGWDNWIMGLLSDAFKVPIFLFLVMVVILFINSNPFRSVFTPDIDGISWFTSLAVPFILIISFFILIEKITKAVSSELSGLVGGAIMKGVGAVAGVGMGGAALLGVGVLGKNSTRFMNSSTGQRLLNSAAGGNKFAQFATKGLRAMQTGSYDMRQTMVGNAVSKEAKVDFNLATKTIDGITGALGGNKGISTGALAGGYIAQNKRKNEKRAKFEKMLEHNKELEADLKNNKENKEEEKANLEIQAKDEKAILDQVRQENEARIKAGRAILEERERALKESELRKKEADNKMSDLEKLEDLIAKRKDTSTRGFPVGELDVQIKRIEDKLTNGAGGLTAIDAATGHRVTNIEFGTQKTNTSADKIRAKREEDAHKGRITIAKDNLKRIDEENERLLDGPDGARTKLKATEEAMRRVGKDISKLTEAIENVKNDRSNKYKQSIRNKSGGIYRRSTYTQTDIDIKGEGGTQRQMTQTEISAFENLQNPERMNNITRSVGDRRSRNANGEEEVNTGYITGQLIRNTIVGGVGGIITGDMVGAGTNLAQGIGGLVGVGVGLGRGVNEIYQPGNEAYGTDNMSPSWAENASDGYKPN